MEVPRLDNIFHINNNPLHSCSHWETGNEWDAALPVTF